MKSKTAVIDSFRTALAKPVELNAMLAKAGQKDRNNVEKYLATLGAEHGTLWRRLTRALGTLAPLAITTVGQQVVQFFVADGKYRMQVFALEDAHDNTLLVYMPDVLDKAIKLKIVGPKGSAKPIQIDQLNNDNWENPAPHFKNMLGWNRKAMKLTVPINATDAQLETLEHLAALAAQEFTKA